MNAPDQYLIDKALDVAALSPCQKSRRGVVIWDQHAFEDHAVRFPSGTNRGAVNGALRGEGFNGPPIGFVCLGREACRWICALRCVHAEMRAIRDAEASLRNDYFTVPGPGVPLLDMLHVELAADGGIVPCDGPSCAQCSKHIVDAGFIGRVWLYERTKAEAYDAPGIRIVLTFPSARWVSYEPAEFHRLSLIANGSQP